MPGTNISAVKEHLKPANNISTFYCAGGKRADFFDVKKI
jgi:hypothetical protein